MRLLKKDTARDVVVFMTDVNDHTTGKTGLTLTITASKDAGSFNSISPTVTELTNGWYKLALTTSHIDTKGDFALHITGSGADPTDVLMQVVTDLPGDTVASVSGAVGSVTSGVTVTTNNDKTGYRLSATGVDDVWDELTSGHSTSGSYGKLITDNLNAAVSGLPSAATVADAVWDEATADHVSAGSFGAFVQKLLTVAKFLGLK